MVDDVLQQAQARVGKPAATMLVTSDTRERQFIGEVFFIGAVVFLLEQYCAGFLRGLGLDDMAERHGRKAAKLIARLRAKKIGHEELAAETQGLEEALREIRAAGGSETAKVQAEARVVRTLSEAGLLPEQARDIASGLSEAVSGSAPKAGHG